MARKKKATINVEDLGNGFVRLTPAEGLSLYSVALDRTFPVVVVKAERASAFVAR